MVQYVYNYYKDEDGFNKITISYIYGLYTVNFDGVTDMSTMFYECTGLTSLDLRSFDTSEVTTMNSMFYYCTSLTSLDLSSFNTSKVTAMNSMFHDCTSLTSLDLSSFDTSKVTAMDRMFYYCTSLTSLDLSSFDTSAVLYMDYMFLACFRLTTLTLGTNWASNTNITSLSLSDCRLTHDSCLDVFNKLATRTNSPTLTLKSTTKSLMSSSEISIATNKGWTVS